MRARHLLPSTALLLGPLAALTLAAPVEYPCPSDPGFCYRDTADDGCFDPAVDSGPIDEEIQSSSTPPADPPPGSIVCPPSVKTLVSREGAIRLATPAGSSILFFGTRIRVRPGLPGGNEPGFEAISGDDLRVDGVIVSPRVVRLEAARNLTAHGRIASDEAIAMDAEGDIEIQGALEGRNGVYVQSLGGDLVVGPRTRVRTNGSSLLAPVGDLTLHADFAFVASGPGGGGLRIEAAGTVRATRATLNLDGRARRLRVAGESIEFLDSLELRLRGFPAPFRTGVSIMAQDGNVVFDRLRMATEAEVLISGHDIRIGREGRAPRSKVRLLGSPFQQFVVAATGALQVENLRIQGSHYMAMLGTEGLVFRDSLVRGKPKVGAGSGPSLLVRGGPGVVCDLTETKVVDAPLTTECDSVIR